MSDTRVATRPYIIGGANTTFVVPNIVNPETNIWATAVTNDGGTVSATEKGFVDTLISALKAHGIWTLLDRMWLLASENVTQAKFDIVGANPTTSITGSPTFTASQGYTGNGTSSFIDTGWSPASSSIFLQDSAHVFAYMRTMGSGSKADVGILNVGGTSAVQIVPNLGGDFSNVNSTAADFVGTTVAAGLIYSRTASNLTTKYTNGGSAEADAAVSAARSAGNLFILARNNLSSATDLFSDHQVSIVSVGAGLSALQAGNLFTDVNAYMTSLGTAIFP